MPGVVEDYVKAEELERELAAEREWAERYGEEAEEQEWVIGESTHAPREDDNEAEKESAYRIKAW